MLWLLRVAVLGRRSIATLDGERVARGVSNRVLLLLLLLRHGHLLLLLLLRVILLLLRRHLLRHLLL